MAKLLKTVENKTNERAIKKVNYSLKPKPVINPKTNAIIGSLVFFITLFVYYLTFARSLSFWDCGEYITCSSILGIPHPPGNPFYILVGRFLTTIFGFIPHAIIVDFLSSVMSAFAVLFTYLFTVKLMAMFLDKKDAYQAYIAGSIAALFIAFSFTFWDNSIEAEVYAGLALFINMIAWITMIWVEKSRGLSHQHLLLLMIYLFFLGFGIHQTVLQIAPAVLFIVLYPMITENYKENKIKFWKLFSIYLVGILVVYLIFIAIGAAIHIPDLPKMAIAVSIFGLLYIYLRKEVGGKVWLLALLLIALGLSPHIFLIIRSEHRPFINEGYPHTWKLFKDYVLRAQYGPTSMFDRRATFIYQLKDQFLTYFSWQFFHPETLSKWFKIPAALIQMIGNLIVSLLGIFGIYYQYKKNKHSFVYLFSFFFMASIAMVFVMNLSDKEVRVRDYFFVTAYNFWTVWMGMGAIAIFTYLLKRIKPLAYIALIGIFGLVGLNLAANYHIHDKHNQLIPLDYGMNLLNGLEENAIIFTNGDNDTFPLWYAQAVYDPWAKEHVYPARDVYPTEHTKEIIKKAMDYKKTQLKGIRHDVTVANLSLLNTPWYIKQLRDLEGVEFNIPDKHIDLSQTSPSSVLFPKKIPKNMTLTVYSPNKRDSLEIPLKKDKILYVKDLAILQIIKDNFGKRPIYFAVTVPEMSEYKDYLKNEGMVYRLVSTKGKDQLDPDRIVTNIDSVYSYRCVFDDKVYKDENMKRLLNNYGSGYFNLALYYRKKHQFGKAIKYMENGIKFFLNKSRFYPGLAQLYTEAAFYLMDHKMYDEAFLHLENAMYYDHDDKRMPQILYTVAIQTGKYAKAVELLRKLKPYQKDNEIIDNYISILNKSVADSTKK